MAKKENTEPGKFESRLDEYPGYFTLPYPFLARHVKVWWEHAVKPLSGLTRLDWDYYEGDWQAAVALIRDYGEWHVDGVTVGDLETDAVPALVKAWIMGEAERYIIPFLPPKAVRLIVANM